MYRKQTDFVHIFNHITICLHSVGLRDPIIGRGGEVNDALLRAYNVVCFAITEIYISSASAASA